MERFLLTLLIALALIPGAAGARSSNVCFSRDEVMKMVLVREAFSKEAATCLQTYWNTHARFYNDNKYSKYFGNRSKALNTPEKRALAIAIVLEPNLAPPAEFKVFLAEFNKGKVQDKDGELPNPGLADFEKWLEKANPQKFQAWQQKKPSLRLQERVVDEAMTARSDWSGRRPSSNSKLQNISCIDMTRRCLRLAFEKVGMLDTFSKIDDEVLKNGVSGVELQKALIDLGWKSFYWNPDVSQNAEWDEDEKKSAPLPPGKRWNPAWGGHVSRWSRNCAPDGTKLDPTKTGGVLCSDLYYLGSERPVPIDDKKLLVNFGIAPPPQFNAVPFWIGSGHSGYHVFPGFLGGKIIEAHSQRPLRARDNLEVSVFNPLDQGNKGGPRWTRSEKYRSGVIVVPPGYLESGPLRLHEPQMDGACADLKPARK